MKPQLKQQNKKHKTAEKSKRQSKAENKGKMNEVIKTHQKTKKNNKLIRKEQRKLKMKKQLAETAQDHTMYGGPAGAPILCVVVPLDTAVSPWMVRSLIKSCVEDECWVEARAGSSFHFSLPQFRKRLSLRLGCYSNLFMTMDLAKVADYIIFAVKNVETLVRDEYGLTMLSSLYGQGLPRCGFITLSDTLKLNELRKFVESKYPVEKNQFWTLDKKPAVQQLLRHICQGLPDRLGYRDWRTYMLAETVDHMANNEEAWLEVSGHLRGRAFDVNSRVHVTGWGDFAVEEVFRQVDPIPARSRKNPDPLDVEGASLAKPTPVGEDTEMDEGKMNEKIEVFEDEEDSDDVEMDDEGMDSGSDEDSEDGSSIDGSSVKDDENGDDDEEMEDDDVDPQHDAELARFRRAREEEEFPDEIDTPVNVPARKRFTHYQSLTNLRSNWDIDSANVPAECRQLLSFTNFRHFRNRLKKAAAQAIEGESGTVSVEMGRFVRLKLRPLSEGGLDGYFERRAPNHPLVLFSLLPTEDKRSMLHLSLRAHFPQAYQDVEDDEEDQGASGLDLARFDTEDLDEYLPEARLEQRRAAEKAPIKSKDPMVLQVGFRRFLARPIYSEDHHGAPWHRFRRFFNPAEPAMASVVGPIVFPPCPVLMFRGACREVLVATGSVASCDPRRRCLKRVVLSGHAFKVRGRNAVIRYMFFNPDDIDFYKSVELKTKQGRRGRIVESLGTHGLMKCRFDRNISQLDVALMPLYKPVYPKGLPVDMPLGRMREPTYRRT